MIAGGELGDGVMRVLVPLVLQLQSYDGQAVEEEDEVNLLLALGGRWDAAETCRRGRLRYKVQMQAERDAVLRVFVSACALGGTGLGIEKPELQPAHFQPVAQEHPERRVRQFLAERLEDLVPRVRAVIVLQLLERVSLRGLEQGPQVVFGDEVLRVRDVGLFQHTVAMFADQVIRDVLLKRQLRGFLPPRHGFNPPASKPE
jgi:hypothetical protein